MIYVALILTGILLLIANVSVRLCGPKNQVPTVLCAVCTALGCLCYPLFALNSLLVCFAVFGCAAVGARPNRVLLASFGMTVVAYGLFSIVAIAPEIKEWSELKDRYPMESMTDRLAYEQRRTESPAKGEEQQTGSPNL